MSKSPITCHVLDSSIGKPAAGVSVSVQQQREDDLNSFEVFATGVTDSDGRCTTLFPSPDSGLKAELKAGRLYKVIFMTRGYFARSDRKCFYPWVEITFEVENASEHFHIPLLISPYSYTTYRGS
ncbi:hypothetical protein JAAARDRAFT_371070 [Jaapia argillacea MUCL 33604]|uniref:5-hydroxyisourate hydrolase n=1 Tax=Jaapia argillacea MUCL 33604 TaxID=933084 RepID=A0A067QKQ4_9AGAM|nr:hypothetical protein JAAARDRAFT_371070 [Jaapia argillacea MUCL 33604]